MIYAKDSCWALTRHTTYGHSPALYALCRHGESEQLRGILPPLPPHPSPLHIKILAHVFIYRRRSEFSTYFLPIERRPTYLSTHPIYYFMTNIFDCPDLFLSATEGLNHTEVCWSLAGPEQRATYSYTYPIHIQPSLSHHMCPGHVIPCHVIFPAMQSREEVS